MNKKLKVFLISVLIVILCLFSFYYYIGSNFGKAAHHLSKDYVKVRENLFDDTTSTVDTVYNQFKADVDSLLKMEGLKK